jgi:hypothetical protein
MRHSKPGLTAVALPAQIRPAREHGAAKEETNSRLKVTSEGRAWQAAEKFPESGMRRSRMGRAYGTSLVFGQKPSVETLGYQWDRSYGTSKVHFSAACLGSS